MTKVWKKICFGISAALVFLALLFGVFALSFRRPYRKTVLEFSTSPPLAFSVIKAESGFSEKAVSEAGAVGLMQIMPATAQFVCERNGIIFDEQKLTDGNYNAMLGCLYLNYLLTRFSDAGTAVAAYNAGEGTVSQWLRNAEYSGDGIRLDNIPYEETRSYVKKVLKYQKIYAIFD